MQGGGYLGRSFSLLYFSKATPRHYRTPMYYLMMKVILGVQLDL